MVTRVFATQEAREFRQEMGRAQNTIRGTILPALGLSLAFNFLTGGMSGATGAGVAMGQATFGVQTRMQDLADRLALVMLPVIDDLADGAEDAIDKFLEWDERTDGLASRLVLGAGAAYLFRGQIAAITRLLLTPAGAGTVGALLAGGLTFNTIRDLQEGGIDRALDPTTSRNAQVARAVQDRITGFLGLPDVRRGAGPDFDFTDLRDYANIFTNFAGVDAPAPSPVNQAAQDNRIINHFNITSHSTEQLLAQLQDALDQGLLRMP